MNISNIKIRSFRNINEIDIKLNSKISIFYGSNAQGKTNILEALFVLSNLNSFRTRKIKNLIYFNSKAAKINGLIHRDQLLTELSVTLSQQSKKPTINGKSPASIVQYLSEFPTVLFSPLDLTLARGNQDLRRRYIDRAVFIKNPQYLSLLRGYSRILKQRNASLRSGRNQLYVWNQQLAEIGGKISSLRRSTLRDLLFHICNIHASISGKPDSIQINCHPEHDEKSDLREYLLAQLEKAEERDQHMGYTTVGPHRDAIRLRLDGKDMEQYASQGQLRTLALSLKLALLSWSEEMTHKSPLFLLDDPGSELDEERLQFLGSFLAEWNGQVLITGTSTNSIPLPNDANIALFNINNGKVY